MEISSLRRSSLSSLPRRRSPAISRHCFSFTSNPVFRNSYNLRHRSLDPNRFGLVLSRVVKSKEDLKEEWELDEEEERSLWNPLDRLQELRIKLDSEITYKALVYGSGVLTVLLITSVITSALDSIPLVPKLLEVVGLGYTVWFTARYLIFKENRDELFGKVEDLKDQIFGDRDD